MKYLLLSVMLLAAPVQAADKAKYLSTQECLQLIRDYWKEYETTGVDPNHIFEKFDARCEGTKELDNLMINDKLINDTTARLAEKGVI